MTIIPVNGRNERMGSLFKTPKHLLLHEGKPAIQWTAEYMSQFGKVVILANRRYYAHLVSLLPKCEVVMVDDTNSVIDTLMQYKYHFKGELFIVDCDVVVKRLKRHRKNTVYCFENNEGLNQYSNFSTDQNSLITECNEKEKPLQYAGAGVYYFDNYDSFCDGHVDKTSVAQVIARNMEHYYDHHGKNFVTYKTYVETDCEIIRIGTLPDIVGSFTGNKLSVIKEGSTVNDELEWYAAYEDKGDIPNVKRKDFYALQMDLLCPVGPIEPGKVLEIVERYRYYPRMNNHDFEFYRERIRTHLVANPISNAEKLIEDLKYTTLTATFCHGDLSTRNIIKTAEGHKLIDPLYSVSKFGSYVLDYAKLLFSLKFYENNVEGFDTVKGFVGNQVKIDTLIASECVRVATYNRKFNFIAENLINEL